MFGTATPSTDDCSASSEGSSLPLAQDLELVLSDDVVIESEESHHVVLANLETAKRIRVSRPLYEFVRAFRKPTRVAALVSAVSLEKLRPQIKLLLSQGILLDTSVDYPSAKRRLRSNVAYRFCNSPAFDPRNPTDFTVLGLPCDTETDHDSRLAPDALRRKSLDFPFRRGIADNRPVGWFDADTEKWVLRGTTISDAGDVTIEHGESQECLFRRVGEVLAEIRTGGSVPIILGGDRIATEAALRGLGEVTTPAIVRLKENATLSLPPAGSTVYLSINLTSCNLAYRDPNSVAAATLSSLAGLKNLILELGRTNPIVVIDVVGLDMRSEGARLGTAMGCELVLAAMEAADASAR